MPRFVNNQYFLHYSPPSLDSSINQAYSDDDKLKSDLREAILSLLVDDCDLHVEDPEGNYLTIELSLQVVNKPGGEPVQITF